MTEKVEKSTKNILKEKKYQEQTAYVYTKVENELTNNKMFDIISI